MSLVTQYYDPHLLSTDMPRDDSVALCLPISTAKLCKSEKCRSNFREIEIGDSGAVEKVYHIEL